MSDTTALTLRLPADIHQRLRAQADRDGRSVNQLVRRSIEKSLEQVEPEALDLRDSMEALARAWQDVDQRLKRLERMAEGQQGY